MFSTSLRLLLPLSTILIPFLFWESELLTTALLCAIFILFMTVDEHRRHLPIFFYSFTLGPISELICIYAGAWSYSNAYLLPIPLWLPFIWGMAGVHMSEMSEKFNSKK